MDKEKTLRKLKQEIEEVREKFGVEFAEVVRCKDCKHGRVFSLKKRLVDCPYHDDHMVDFDHFCSYGERRDDNV